MDPELASVLKNIVSGIIIVVIIITAVIIANTLYDYYCHKKRLRLFDYAGIDRIDHISRDLSAGDIMAIIVKKLQEKIYLLDYRALSITRQLHLDGVIEKCKYDYLNDIVFSREVSPTAISYSYLCNKWEDYYPNKELSCDILVPWIRDPSFLEDKRCSEKIFMEIKEYERKVKECACWWKWWDLI